MKPAHMITKSTAEHTPGPWKVDGDLIVAGDGDDVIGSIDLPSNAAFIAAAPETAAERDRLRESNAALAKALKESDELVEQAFGYLRGLYSGELGASDVKMYFHECATEIENTRVKTRAALARHAKAEGRG